jgi:CBS domain-containing protein
VSIQSTGPQPARELKKTNPPNAMKLKDIMSTKVEIVQPDASIQEAAEKMHSLDIGALPVCDGRRLSGMITDRDITIRAVAAGRDPKTTLVRDCLTRSWSTASKIRNLKKPNL